MSGSSLLWAQFETLNFASLHAVTCRGSDVLESSDDDENKRRLYDGATHRADRELSERTHQP